MKKRCRIPMKSKYQIKWMAHLLIEFSVRFCSTFFSSLSLSFSSMFSKFLLFATICERNLKKTKKQKIM